MYSDSYMVSTDISTNHRKKKTLLYCSACVIIVTFLMVTVIFLFKKPHPLKSAVMPEKISANAWTSAAEGKEVDIIVLLENQPDLLGANFLADKKEKSAYVFERLINTATSSQVKIRQWLDARRTPYRSFYIVNSLQLHADAAILVALSQRDDVKRVITNPQLKLSTNPGVPFLVSDLPQSVNSIPWGVQRVRAPEVWAWDYHGEGVVVAGQDTGYDWDHPALKNSYRGWDGQSVSHDYFWHDAIHSGGGACGADSPVPCDDHWHGTHTMGTIAGASETDQIGVAPGAKWIGCRNMSEGMGTPASYAECFEFFLAPYPVSGEPQDGNPTYAPDVINNSWSCPVSEGCDADHIAYLNQVVNNVRAAGIMVVASAGNDGSICSSVNEPPGMFDATYTVGATSSDTLDSIASFSSRGTGTSLLKPDITAPGMYVKSSIPGSGYIEASGTSMASPHIVGVIALLWSANPAMRGELQLTEDILNLAAVDRYSTQCGDPSGTVPNNVYGWGRVDALAAVQLVVGTLSGSVTDHAGQGIPSVEISLESSPDYVKMTTTNTAGAYVLHPVSGTYTVTFSKLGYVTQVFANIAVSTVQTTTLSTTMITHDFFIPLLLHTP